MPPLLALTLGLIFIGYLLRRDSKEEPRVSAAIWVPTTWLMIIGSRPVSTWFNLGVPAPVEEGSPFDRMVYTILIVIGLWILAGRRVNVAKIIRSNIWLTLFLLYEGISFIWSDYPFVSFKRWSKALGDPIMVLILWSELDPVRAITAVFKRCGYVLITLSVVFCKYFENIGRAFDQWGQAFNTGVTTNKNLLGYLLFTFGLFFFVSLINRLGNKTGDWKHRRVDQLIDLGFLVLIAWLHMITDSKTALLAMFVGMGVVLTSRFATVRRRFGVWVVAGVLVFAVLESTLSLSNSVTAGAGRDETFTGRTGLWETLLQEPINPVVGEGYASFWLGERLDRFWRMYPASPPTEAHNGYLEMYLNLGIVGLVMLVGLLWAGLVRARRRLPWAAGASTHDERVIAIYGLAYGVAYLFYNITEATFVGLNFLFVVFLIFAFNYPDVRARLAASPSQSPRRQPQMQIRKPRIGALVGPRIADRDLVPARSAAVARRARGTKWPR